MNINFSDKTILITGATRGIGAKIAEDLSNLGANLLLTGTDKIQIEKLNKKMISSNKQIRYFVLNPIKKNTVESFFKKINKYKRIDCIVNNAGINRLNYINKTLMNDFDEMMEVNLKLPYQIIRNLSTKMLKNNYGRIVNIGSIFGVISKERRSMYSATKFGIHGITVGSSNDLAGNNIFVNTVSPGFVLTDLTKQNLSSKEMELLKEQIPAKKLADTSYISNLVMFLLSDYNKYITGQNIIADGGFTNI